MKKCKEEHSYEIVNFDYIRSRGRINACLECDVCKLRVILLCFNWDYKIKIAELWEAGKITTSSAKKLESDICHRIYEATHE